MNFSPFPLNFLILSLFPLHFLAARLQGCNDSCSLALKNFSKVEQIHYMKINLLQQQVLCISYKQTSPIHFDFVRFLNGIFISWYCYSVYASVCCVQELITNTYQELITKPSRADYKYLPSDSALEWLFWCQPHWRRSPG